MNKTEGELLEEVLRKRIRQLEVQIKEADIKIQERAKIKQLEAELLKKKEEIREAAVVKVSLKGGIFELKKLLEAYERSKQAG